MFVFITTDGTNNPVLEKKLAMLCRSPFHSSYECLFSELQSVGASVESINDMYHFPDVLNNHYQEEMYLKKMMDY